MGMARDEPLVALCVWLAPQCLVPSLIIVLGGGLSMMPVLCCVAWWCSLAWYRNKYLIKVQISALAKGKPTAEVQDAHTNEQQAA